jgi:hypothetical protein
MKVPLVVDSPDLRGRLRGRSCPRMARSRGKRHRGFPEMGRICSARAAGNEGIIIVPEKDPMKRLIAQRPVQSESMDQ